MNLAQTTHKAYVYVFLSLSAGLRSMNDDGTVGFRASCFMLAAELMAALELLALVNKFIGPKLPSHIPYIAIVLVAATFVLLHERLVSVGVHGRNYAHHFQQLSKLERRRWAIATWVFFLVVVAATIASFQYLRSPPRVAQQGVQADGP